MMAVHRDAYETLMPDAAMLRTNVKNIFRPLEHSNEPLGVREYLSEDWAFCHRCREAGIPIHSYAKPQTVHWGDFGYTPRSADPHKTAKDDGILRP